MTAALDERGWSFWLPRRQENRMSAAFEVIDGTPNYNLYVGGQWIRSSRNEVTESRNPATGELFAKVQQAGAAETEQAISAAHGAYKAWAATPVSAREAVFFRAADVLAAKTNEIVDVLIQESVGDHAAVLAHIAIREDVVLGKRRLSPPRRRAARRRLRPS